MSTDEIIDAEGEENETTGAAEEIVNDAESAAHSNYKVPKISADAVKHHLSGMYQNWFLDYASYVILERAVPDIYDGLKPVAPYSPFDETTGRWSIQQSSEYRGAHHAVSPTR